MSDKKAKTQIDGIPTELLNDLGEFTVGGYALFYFDANTGMPRHVMSFDSPAHYIAMQKYLSDWTKALEAVYIEGTKNNIIMAMGDNEEEGGE